MTFTCFLCSIVLLLTSYCSQTQKGFYFPAHNSVYSGHIFQLMVVQSGPQQDLLCLQFLSCVMRTCFETSNVFAELAARWLVSQSHKT